MYLIRCCQKGYKTCTNWVGISDKIMGYHICQGWKETLPRYNTTHTFTWYPSKADLIAGKTMELLLMAQQQRHLLGNKVLRRTSDTSCYCKLTINSAKTTSFIRPTSSSNANQTEYINFDTVASTTSRPYCDYCSVTSYENTSGTTNNYTNQSINYGSTIEFDNTRKQYFEL